MTRFGPCLAALLIAGCGSGSVAGNPGPDAGVDAGTCEFPPGAVLGPMVRVIYLVPSDRVENPAYTEALEFAARHAQLWFRERTAGGITFPVHKPVVDVIRTDHPASYYSTHDEGGDPRWRFWANAFDEALALSGGTTTRGGQSWIYYIDAEPACGQVGGATTGAAALMGVNDLRGLAGMPTLPICPEDEPSDEGRCRWIGALAYFVSHTVGLGCGDEPGCPDDHIAGGGLWTYPDATLAPGDEEILTATPVFRQVTLPQCSLDCR